MAFLAFHIVSLNSQITLFDEGELEWQRCEMAFLGFHILQILELQSLLCASAFEEFGGNNSWENLSFLGPRVWTKNTQQTL